MTPTPDTEERRIVVDFNNQVTNTILTSGLIGVDGDEEVDIVAVQVDWKSQRAAAPQPAEPGLREARLYIPADVEEWIDEAIIAMNREGSVDWDDERRVAEAVAVRLWNYLSEGLIPAPAALARDAEPAGLDVAVVAAVLHGRLPMGHRQRNPVIGEEHDTCDIDADIFAAEYVRLRESAKPEGGA